MSAHEQPVGATDEWYTPPYVFEALGCTFDLDVAHPGTIDWVPCLGYLTERSLERDWQGFVWMNPPFGTRNGLVPWVRKFITHGNGVSLVPDRTSAPWWQYLASCAEAALFVSPKIKFLDVNGTPRGGSPACGITMFSVGRRGHLSLRRAAQKGLGTLFINPHLG